MWKLPACFETAIESVCSDSKHSKHSKPDKVTYHLVLQEPFKICVSKQATSILKFAPWLAMQLASLGFQRGLDSMATEHEAERPRKLSMSLDAFDLILLCGI